MQIAVNGTKLWFDVDGPAVVPDGDVMRDRPVLVLVHGGPGSYDHSYFKPDFAALTRIAQVVYLDLREHGRSGRHDPEQWSFEVCADDVHAFCDALGIARPIVLGHSMGGFVTILYGARHPGHAAGLVLLGTCARWDTERLVEGFRHFAGDEVAELARRDYSGEDVTDEEWARVFAAFGPRVPDKQQLGRRIGNPGVGRRGAALMRDLDLVEQLPRIESPTLVCTGDLDAPLPIAAAEEILAGLRPGVGRLEVIEGAGHFMWLDRPDDTWRVIGDFVTEVYGASS